MWRGGMHGRGHTWGVHGKEHVWRANRCKRGRKYQLASGLHVSYWNAALVTAGSEGYVFTRVCHSVNSEGGLPSEGVSLLGGMPSEGGVPSEGVCLLGGVPSEGVCLLRGCAFWGDLPSGGVCLLREIFRQTPP